MVILFVVVVAGAYLGAMSGSGLATLAIIGFLLAIVMLFKDYILSGGII
jgi:TRAP-type C4-dicarboxylate transport system permease large subunit